MSSSTTPTPTPTTDSSSTISLLSSPYVIQPYEEAALQSVATTAPFPAGTSSSLTPVRPNLKADLSVLSSPRAFPPLLNDTFLRALTHQSTAFTPIWCHRQAGRYLPQFRAVRKEVDFFTVCRSPLLACEVTLQPIRLFDLDAAIIFSDILVVLQCIGMEVLMEEKKGPVIVHPIQTPEDFSRLKKKEDINVRKDLNYVFQAITLTRHSLAGTVPLIGFSGAPFTLFCYMIESGSGTKSYDKTRAFMYKYPKQTKAILQFLTDIIIEYLQCQCEAGAQALELFDSWVGVVTPDLFNEFLLDNYIQIAKEVKQKCNNIPMTVFPKGAHFALQTISEQTAFDCISIDWSTPPQWARTQTTRSTHPTATEEEKNKNNTPNTSAPSLCLQGNLDVSLLYAEEGLLRQSVRSMIDSFGTQQYIANLGHGMLPDHSPQALAVFVDEVHQYSKKLNEKQQ